MAKYASDTTVSPARSRAEIEETLQRYGAEALQWTIDELILLAVLGGAYERKK
jgi:hypothetical protein